MPAKTRRYKRPTEKQCEKLNAAVSGLIQSLGALPNAEPIRILTSLYAWRLPTRYGDLFIDVQDDWIPCRFREPERLPGWIQANPHSGKWNFFCGDHSTPVADKLRILDSALRSICHPTNESRPRAARRVR
jgi:hypothetical protein